MTEAAVRLVAVVKDFRSVRAVDGFERPTAGRVDLSGSTVSGRAAHRARARRQPQWPRSDPRETGKSK
jgi:hypothetical protein